MARNIRKVVVLSFALATGVAVGQTTQGQQHSAEYQKQKKEANENVVTIMASDIASPYTRFAEDIQNVVDQPNVAGGVRVLPILGRGGGQNASDVLLLKGVDMGVLEKGDVDVEKAKDPAIFANSEHRILYITKLANSEFQMFGRAEIKSLKDLEGKKVNFFKKNSSTQLACDKIFRILNIKVEPVYYDQSEASAKLRSGEIAAFARFASAPHSAFTSFKASEGFHFIPIDGQSLPPQDFQKLLEIYTPALLKNEQYPQLLAVDKPVPTISGSLLLVVYAWPPGSPKYKALTQFVDRFFDNIAKFQEPGHQPKWKEINIAYNVPGWTRFKPAQDWLNAHRSATSKASAQ